MKYSVGWITVLVTSTIDSPLCAIRAPATELCQIREMGIFPDAANTGKIALARASTVSVTPTGNIAAQNTTPGAPASGTVIATGWATAPVIDNTKYLREATTAATAGAGIIWTWPADRPLVVGLGSAIAELVLVNVNTTGQTVPTFRCWLVFEN